MPKIYRLLSSLRCGVHGTSTVIRAEWSELRASAVSTQQSRPVPESKHLVDRFLIRRRRQSFTSDQDSILSLENWDELNRSNPSLSRMPQGLSLKPYGRTLADSYPRFCPTWAHLSPMGLKRDTKRLGLRVVWSPERFLWSR